MFEMIASMVAGALAEYFNEHPATKRKIFIVTFLVFTPPTLLYGFLFPSMHGMIDDLIAGVIFGLYVAVSAAIIFAIYEWRKKAKTKSNTSG